ncbi:hypothetical protein ABFS83_02G109200 [Erythranthe nasuta]
MLVQSFVERLRPLVGIKSWDYIILWKLSSDHRCIEWMECCCAGGENIKNGGEELIISFQCRDCIFPHPRIKSCDLLDQLPSSMPLDSGVHAQTLLSNQSGWLNYSHNCSDSSLSEETIGTRVLIPLSLGLLELFVTKQVSEDQQLIDFIRSQFNFFMEEQTITNNNNINNNINNNSETTDSFSSDLHPNNNNNNNNIFQHQIMTSSSDFPKVDNQINCMENNLPQDISIDRIHLSTNPNLQHQQFVVSSENGNGGIFLEGADFTPSIENNNNNNELDPTQMNEDSSNFRCENNRSDESDPNDDEFDAKYRRRTGKGPQSKNLRAERRRRKKLNDRLYSLRALVPNISKLDRASILGDAIDYVNELKKQAEDLQIELEERSDEEKMTGKDETDQNNVVVTQNGVTKCGPNKRGQGNFPNGFHSNNGIKSSKQNYREQLDDANDKVQQMEPQVEVFELDGNEFYVKVFCEHKSGGFVRLMEALNSLGLEVTNVNTTRHTCLVSSIFKVEQKNNESVEADHVKESLLELTRNPSRNIMWGNRPTSININDQSDEDGLMINNNNNINININIDNDYCVHHDQGGGHHHHHNHSLLHGVGGRQVNSHGHLQH